MTHLEIYREIQAIGERRTIIAEAIKKCTIPGKARVYEKTIKKMTDQISDLFHLLPKKAQINAKKYFKERGKL